MPGSNSTCLAFGRQQELDEGFGTGLVRRIGDDADIGRHDRGHRRIDEFYRKAGGLRREGEEVDDDAVADLAGVDGFRHAERAFGDVAEIAGHRLDRAQPLSQPSPCRIVSIVRCVVPEREGAAIET